QRAVFAPHHALEQSGLDLPEVRDALREQRLFLRGVGVRGAEPQQRFLAVAQHFAEPGVDEFEVALRIRDEDAVRGLLDELTKLGLALADRLLCAPALRDFYLQLRGVALDHVVEDGVLVEYCELRRHHSREALVFFAEFALAALLCEEEPAVHPLLGSHGNAEKVAHPGMNGRKSVGPCIGTRAQRAMPLKKHSQNPGTAAIGV